MGDNFVFYANWLDSIKGLDEDMQDKIISDIVRYGVGVPEKHQDDPVIQAMVNMVRGAIDSSKSKYKEKQQRGVKGGRKKELNERLIWQYAKQKKTAPEIAQLTGYSTSAIYKSDGWKYKENDTCPFA